MYLLDTNVISELRKSRPHGAVLSWRHATPLHQLAIPAVVIGEIQAGVEITRKQDAAKAVEIERWLDQVVNYYPILPMDGEIFREWARLMAGAPVDLDTDAIIAATARVYGRVVVTRNVKHFTKFGVNLFNPFTYSGEKT